jgi:hypothetical protein
VAFSLTKWYLDGVDPEGRAAIAYWMALEWRSLWFAWNSVSVFERDGQARHLAK